MNSLFTRGLPALVTLALIGGTASSGPIMDRPQQDLATRLPVAMTPPPSAVTSPPSESFSASEGRRLSRALDDMLGRHAGRFSLSIRDLTADASYTYHPHTRVATASIIKVEFLIALLLTAQKEHRGLTSAEKQLAVPMIEVSSNDAATDILGRIGGYPGLRAVNRRLGLRNTKPGADGWGTTTTSTKDQIKVLNALTSSHSPLTKANRRYVLHLMENVASDEDWGVSAAAATGTTFAVKVGVLARSVDHFTWIVNCIGRVVNGDHTFLIAAISDHNFKEQDGKTRIEKASKLAVSAMLGAS